MGVICAFLESSYEIAYVWYQNIKRWENYIILSQRPGLIDIYHIICDSCTSYCNAYDHAHSCIQPTSELLLVAFIEHIMALPEHKNLTDIHSSLIVASWHCYLIGDDLF